MNAFLKHHAASIAFNYSCFDRLLLNGYIHALHFGGSIVTFLRQRRGATVISPDYLRRISADYHHEVADRAARDGLDIVTPPRDVRRHDWVEPYFRQLGPRHGIAVILKCRESARVAVCYPERGYHIEPAWRFVNLYYFYLHDAQLGRLFVRVCPYFPFDIRVCLNGHEYLAQQLSAQGIAFDKRDNAFLDCANPARLQELADAFGPETITAALEPHLAQLVPYFSADERAAGYRHGLSVAQAEYCHNAVFAQQAALDKLFSRLLDHNRTIGHPDKLAVIFGRACFHPDTRTGQTEIKVTPLKTTVIKTSLRGTSLKQYVKDRRMLRTETSCFRVKELSVAKGINNLPRLREVMAQSNERYQEAQQDVLASPIDRGQLERLAQASVSASGRRTPGLHLDDRRLLAVLAALTSFAYRIGLGSFRTRELLGAVQRALERPEYRLSQLRYDLGKLRSKGLVVRLPRSQRYELTAEGYRLAVLYQKLYHRLYAPLTASTLEPVPSDNGVLNSRTAKLDKLYAAVDKALHELSEAVGIAA
jgi:hypothetical protein